MWDAPVAGLSARGCWGLGTWRPQNTQRWCVLPTDASVGRRMLVLESRALIVTFNEQQDIPRCCTVGVWFGSVFSG